jgi:hypothetical protein
MLMLKVYAELILRELSSLNQGMNPANKSDSFGVPAAMLEHLTAFTGIFFAYTNTVGAALWAHDLEHSIDPLQALHDLRNKGNVIKGQLAGQLQHSKHISEMEVQLI